MTPYIFELLLTSFVGVMAAALGVLWQKADRAEKMAAENRATLTHLEKHMDKTDELTERLSSLEASFSAEIKNLSVSIRRMESMIVRLDQVTRR